MIVCDIFFFPDLLEIWKLLIQVFDRSNVNWLIFIYRSILETEQTSLKLSKPSKLTSMIVMTKLDVTGEVVYLAVNLLQE